MLKEKKFVLNILGSDEKELSSNKKNKNTNEDHRNVTFDDKLIDSNDPVMTDTTKYQEKQKITIPRFAKFEFVADNLRIGGDMSHIIENITNKHIKIPPIKRAKVDFIKTVNLEDEKLFLQHDVNLLEKSALIPRLDEVTPFYNYIKTDFRNRNKTSTTKNITIVALSLLIALCIIKRNNYQCLILIVLLLLSMMIL